LSHFGSLWLNRPLRARPRLAIATGLAVSSAFNLAGLLLWVRLLTPAEFGTLSLVASAALMVNALGFEWLRLAGARTLADPAAPDGVSLARLAAWLGVAAVVAATFALGTLGATGLALAPPGLTPRWNGAILLLALSEMPFAAVTLVARLRFSATTYAVAMIARSALALGGGVLLVVSGGGPLAIVAATAAAQLGVTAVVIGRDRLWRSSLQGPSTRSDRTELVRLGSPLILGSALALAAGTVDRYLVADGLGVAAVGQYAAPAELVAKTLGFALMAINLGAYPLLVRAYERDGPAAAARALERNLPHLLGAALPILLAMTLFPYFVSRALLGSASQPIAAELLPWLAAAALLRLLVSFHFAVALQLARRMALLSIPPLVMLVLLVPFGPAVLTTRGLVGFAQLLFAAQAAGALSAWWLARRALPPCPH